MTTPNVDRWTGPSRPPGLVIVGGGPAGLAVLLAAQRIGALTRLLDAGVVIVEASADLGAGTIGSHVIRSDSSGTTFVDCLRGGDETPLAALAKQPLVQTIAAAGEGAVPLRDVGRFLAMVGDVLGRMLVGHPRCEVLLGHTARSVQRVGDGWRVVVCRGDGQVRTLVSRKVVLATGAHQPAGRLSEEMVAGTTLMDRCGDRVMQSGEVLATAGMHAVAARLGARRHPRVVVVGGSTSAVSVCHALLDRVRSIPFGVGGVTLLHRRPLRIYYPDAATARAEGCHDFTNDDICPLTGRVFRLAGLRLDSGELVMRALGFGGRPAEPRLRLHHLQQPHDAVALRALDEADIVVAAFGYRPNALPVLDSTGADIQLLAQTGLRKSLVDAACRVLDAAGAPLPGLFGIGLAAGFVPQGRLGGEASFRGQANGLWTWQNDVGALIVDAVCPAPPRPAPVRRTRRELSTGVPQFTAATE